METVKTKLQEFGVFMGLIMFPMVLIIIGTYTLAQRASDFIDGYIPLLPVDMWSWGLIPSLFGCFVVIALGVYIAWSAIPTYKEYLDKC